MEYNVELVGYPLPYWAPEARPAHFSAFLNVSDQDVAEADVEDSFA